MTNPHVSTGLKNLFRRRADFVVIGLTGRTGSGCTTAAGLLAQEFTQLKPPEFNGIDPTPEHRKYRIAREYAASHWRPFFGISVSNVILSFLLDANENDLSAFLQRPEHKLKHGQIDQLIAEWKPAAAKWAERRHALSAQASIEDQQGLLNTWQQELAQFFQTVRKGLGPDSNRLLQLVGDNLRKSGNPLSNEQLPEHFYALPERVAALIEVIRAVQQSRHQVTYIVLDALRNPFELLYFRERFSSFYVMAIATENDDREKRLAHLGFSAAQIAEVDKKEYPEKNKPLSGYDAFTSQNIQSCLEKADLYLRNKGAVPPTNNRTLTI